MSEVIERILRTAGGDGVDFMPSVDSTPMAHEADELLNAWFIERERSIECLLILDRVRLLLRRLAADGATDERLRRRAMELLRSIKDLGRDRPRSES